MQFNTKKILELINSVIYLFLLICPSLFYYYAEKKLTAYMFPFIIVQMMIVLLPMVFGLKRKYLLYITIPFFIFNLFQVGNFSIFEFELTEGALLAIFDTDSNEGSDFLRIIPIWFWGYLLFSIGILVREFKYRNTEYLFSRKIQLLAIALIALLIAPKLLRGDRVHNLKTLLSKMYPTRNILLVMKSIELRSSYSKTYKNINDADLEISKIDENEVHVLIVGESARKMSHSWYGYYRETNRYTKPYIDDFYFIENAYAASNSTIMSLKNTLSFVDEKNHFPLPFILRNAGANAVWISNQGKYGEHLNLISQMAQTGTESIYINNSDFGGVSYDERVLPYIKDKIGSGAQFILVHLLGSHFNYIRRYPKEFDSFTGLVEGKDRYKSDIINKYDNTILYTDYVLSEVIKILKKVDRPVTLTYLSDHGEVVFDDQHDFYGHGGGKEATKYELEVPLMFWMNDLSKNDDRINLLNEYKNKKISLIDFVPLYLKFLGIESKQIYNTTDDQIFYFNGKNEKVFYE